MDRAKKIWEGLGEKDAYFAVATYDEFKRENLDTPAKARFFQGGRDHVDRLWTEFEQNFGAIGRPKRALDYGCGVGRILIPFAGKCEAVLGVDISDSMLAEARANCEEHKLTNVEFQNTDAFESAVDETYDFVHSFIVLQHIKPRIGERVIWTMVERLAPDGLGMIHVTFFDPGEAHEKLKSRIYRSLPFVHAFMSRLRGKDLRFMPMYEYELNNVFRILDKNGCHECFVRFSDHGVLGALIFFRKTAAALY